jgi:protoporphyrin/coproporphyrin ferrochelatase
LESNDPTVGVLLVNLGTPEAPTPEAVRKYLRELLDDARVIQAPGIVRWLLLNAFILPFRPKKSAKMYQEIWTNEGSPLLVYSKRQAEGLGKLLQEKYGAAVIVELGMCCGKPTVPEALTSLRKRGASRLLFIPLFPQQAGSSTGVSFAAAVNELDNWPFVPAMRIIADFHDHPLYIAALVKRIKECWAEKPKGDKLLFSFHGLPRKRVLKGEPYPGQCCKTASLVAQELGLNKDEYVIAFQSRFGPGEWLRPYTDETLRELAKSGTASVDVVCPGFVADCVETLHEVDKLLRASFLKAGGKEFRYIHALNDSPEFIAALGGIVAQNSLGWVIARR